MTYYHGTQATLSVGDTLVPGAAIGASNWEGSDTSVVWLHDNVEAAKRYGVHVYEVEPAGWVVNFSEEAGHDDLPESEWEYVTEAARVVGVAQ